VANLCGLQSDLAVSLARFGAQLLMHFHEQLPELFLTGTIVSVAPVQHGVNGAERSASNFSYRVNLSRSAFESDGRGRISA
jgi:hypothetical protein